MNKRQKRRIRDNIKLARDFQDSASSIMFWVFSEAYLPACSAIVSLVNFPMRKAGII